jgi:hypothetical protein
MRGPLRVSVVRLLAAALDLSRSQSASVARSWGLTLTRSTQLSVFRMLGRFQLLLELLKFPGYSRETVGK